MPHNMQKRKPEVAQLDLEEDVALADDDDNPLAETDAMAVDDARYQMALDYLRRGKDGKQIADQLVRDGIPRIQATRLARRVVKENPDTRLTNAYILFGVAGFSTLLGVVFLGLRLLNTGSIIGFSPAYLFLIGAAWFAFKGWQAYRQAR